MVQGVQVTTFLLIAQQTAVVGPLSYVGEARALDEAGHLITCQGSKGTLATTKGTICLGGPHAVRQCLSLAAWLIAEASVSHLAPTHTTVPAVSHVWRPGLAHNRMILPILCPHGV